MAKESLKHQDNHMTITLAIQHFLTDLKANWKPKTEKRTAIDYHGSNKGDEVEYTVYFDEYRCEWTTERIAFQVAVFEAINRFL